MCPIHNKEKKYRQSELVRRREKLIKLAIAWTHDADLSEDLVQETLLKALATVHTLRDVDVIEVWVVRILRNCWWDYLRRKKTREGACLVETEDNDIQLNEFHQQDIVRKVRYIVSTLPTKQREVLALSDFAGFNYAEIASIVDIPVGTVMSRLFTARKKLRESILRSDTGLQRVTALRCVK